MASRMTHREARAEGEAWAVVTARAEVRRLWSVVGLTGLMVTYVSWRMPESERGDQVWPVGLVLMACLAGHALLAGMHAKKSARRGVVAAWWARWLSVVLESALPTAIVVGLWKFELRSADEAVRSPVVLLYALLLILSPLRLNAWMCLGTGMLSGVGYGLAVWTSRDARTWQGDLFEESVLYTTSAWLLVAGVASAVVAWALRFAVSRVMQEGRARAAAEREISAAGEVQRGLLPSESPSIAGYSFAFWSRPAEKAGGDYYDWQSVGAGRVVVSLADVTGHGLGPALMAAFCRAYARASMDGDEGLPAAMRKVNALLMADLPAGRFVTFAAVLFEEGSDVARLVTAGHGPILVRRREGAVESYLPDAPPLGVVADERFELVQEIRMRTGDALILLTDGFFEWAGESGPMFGLDRLRESLSRGPVDAEGLIAAVRGDVEAYVGGVAQPDDLTMVVVTRA